jgi:tRNA (adenine57-N1/adenine58-N1)-methyltransferase
VARALRPGGVFVAYVPTALQLKDTVEALERRADFAEIESFETLLRNWQVKGLSVRPVHRMVAHSAFIIVARRLAETAAPVTQRSVGQTISSPAIDESAIDESES